MKKPLKMKRDPEGLYGEDFVFFEKYSNGCYALGMKVSLGIRHIGIGHKLADALGRPERVHVFYAEKLRMLVIRATKDEDGRRFIKLKAGKAWNIMMAHPFKVHSGIHAAVKDGAIWVKGVDYNDLMKEALK